MTGDAADYQIPGNPDYDQMQTAWAERGAQDAANAANPNWVPPDSVFGGVRYGPQAGMDAYYNRLFEPEPGRTPAQINRPTFGKTDPYLDYLQTVMRGYKGSNQQLPPGFQRMADLVLQTQGYGRTFRPGVTDPTVGFRDRVPLEQLKKMADAIDAAKGTNRNIKLATVLASMASMGLVGPAMGWLTPALGAVGAGATVGAASGLGTGLAQGAAGAGFDPGRLAVGTGVGAVSGGLAQSGVNPVVSSVGSNLLGQAGNMAMGGKFDPLSLGMAGVSGGARAAGMPAWANPLLNTGMRVGRVAYDQQTRKKRRPPVPGAPSYTG